jgi:IMP dehydrogenase/GMP reductase
MGPVICSKHGKLVYTITSALIAEAIKADKTVAMLDAKIVEVTIDSMEEFGRIEKYYFDAVFLEEKLHVKVEQQLTLVDRSKKNKQLNDRLLINKIFKPGGTVYVCPKCLELFINSKV